MTTTQLVPAKASGPEDRSDGIVVSFDAKWYEAIVAKEISLIIRKRIPTRNKPTWLYFHVNAPKSAICARARLASVALMPIDLVRAHASEICLDIAGIDAYCGKLEEVGAYRIGRIELASVQVSAAELRRHLLYTPPQSFMFLSHKAKATIDKAGNFTKIQPASGIGTK